MDVEEKNNFVIRSIDVGHLANRLDRLTAACLVHNALLKNGSRLELEHHLQQIMHHVQALHEIKNRMKEQLSEEK